ncbi:coiled-coil domain-containing protein 9-like [Poecile atricapillus]|uniref:coiled-coil domain-containing protein 9-like n=1 Tax=Poecile atricapillus TaxID=48891 RepID=UPI00273845C9|nr:coiled-coil domain-containing protein 9-like [Poecile atricapillus]
MAAALEKDAELDRRIAALRRKNEALVRRYQEIEADRRAAELQGGAVTARPPRGGQRHPQSEPKPPPRDPKPPQGPPRTPGRPQGGGGAGGGSRPRRPRGRGGGAGGGDGSDRKSQEWEQRRLQNIEQMNEEMQKIAEYERNCRDGFPDPSPNPVRNFLDDPRRRGPERGRGPGGGSRRRGRSWGGAELGKNTSRRGGIPAPLDPTLWMTGRERAEYERWKRERDRIDRERLERHRDPKGAWRREWDAQKPEGMSVWGEKRGFWEKNLGFGGDF